MLSLALSPSVRSYFWISGLVDTSPESRRWKIKSGTSSKWVWPAGLSLLPIHLQRPAGSLAYNATKGCWLKGWHRGDDAAMESGYRDSNQHRLTRSKFPCLGLVGGLLCKSTLGLGPKVGRKSRLLNAALWPPHVCCACTSMHHNTVIMIIIITEGVRIPFKCANPSFQIHKSGGKGSCDCWAA